MPFKSLAQERFLFAKHPDVAAKYMGDSGHHQPANLPEHVEHAPGAAPVTSMGQHGQRQLFHTPGASSPWLKMKTGGT